MKALSMKLVDPKTAIVSIWAWLGQSLIRIVIFLVVYSFIIFSATNNLHHWKEFSEMMDKIPFLNIFF